MKLTLLYEYFDRDEAARLYSEEGKEIDEIARIMDVSTRTIYRLLSSRDLLNRPSRSIKYHFDRDEAVRLYSKEGKGPAEISRIMDVPLDVIKNLLKQKRSTGKI